jgi:hypothetical protein
MRPRSPRCEVRLGRLKSALAAVGGGGVGVCWCSRTLVGQQVPSRGVQMGRCGGPTDMVAVAEALARVACRGGEDGAWSGG